MCVMQVCRRKVFSLFCVVLLLTGCQRSEKPAPVEQGYVISPSRSSNRVWPQHQPQPKPSWQQDPTHALSVRPSQSSEPLERGLQSPQSSQSLSASKEIEIIEIKGSQEHLLTSFRDGKTKKSPSSEDFASASLPASEPLLTLPIPSRKPPSPCKKEIFSGRRVGVPSRPSPASLPVPPRKPSLALKKDKKLSLEEGRRRVSGKDGALPMPPLKPPFPQKPLKEEASFFLDDARGTKVLDPPAPSPEPDLPEKKHRLKKPKKPSLQATPSFAWPLQGRLLRGFSKSGTTGRNDGVNIEGTQGAPVRAARAGKVVYVGAELQGFGQLILIKHDEEWMSAYAHLSQVQVYRGERVKQGQIIGLVGTSGNVARAQLHFEIRRYAQPVDPRLFLE